MHEDVLCRVVLIVACTMAIALQYIVLHSERTRAENRIVQQLLEGERKQYTKALESIAEVNRQCHDLKYYLQLSQWQALPGEYRRKLEQTVAFYDEVAKTGNEVIDTVLTEKTLFCKKHDIALTCMADGACAGFIDRADLYVLLENAFDNAIEATMKCSRGERFIVFRFCRQRDMLTVHMENGCAGKTVFENGLPQTSKKQKDKHGYGVKSIRALAQRYDGYAGFRYEQGTFFLDIMMPIPLDTDSGVAKYTEMQPEQNDGKALQGG